jgi:hypothetical protein
MSGEHGEAGFFPGADVPFRCRQACRRLGVISGKSQTGIDFKPIVACRFLWSQSSSVICHLEKTPLLPDIDKKWEYLVDLMKAGIPSDNGSENVNTPDCRVT